MSSSVTPQNPVRSWPSSPPPVGLLSMWLIVACNHDIGAPTGDFEVGASTSSSTSPDSPLTGAVPTTSGAESTTSADPGETTIGETTGTTGQSGSTGEPDESTGDPPSPACGDGQLDPGEQCDPGLLQLSQTGACTLSCQSAKCGDNLIWEGHEACDNGASNNDEVYGGCTSECQLGPACGDSQVQGPEECDLGVDNGTGESPPAGVPCDSGCRFQARLVFLSSAVYQGGEIGGVEGAHIKCRNLAKLAKYDNATKFMAWISDAQHSPLQDFAHGPETAGLAYVRPDGVRVADDWDALVLKGPIAGIAVTETGEVLLDRRVWTGTAPSGKVLDPAAHCQSWTSSSGNEKSRVGSSGVDKLKYPQAWAQWVADRQWTNLVSWTCDEALHLYCVEQ